MHRIALEEHFMAPEGEAYFRSTATNISSDLFARALSALSDFGERRLAAMDEAKTSFAVLSLAGPGVQIEPDINVAVRCAWSINDGLASRIAERPERFGGFAHLALQDPRAAADELERCVTELGFQGALINGNTLGVYLDDPRFDVVWERAAGLGAPLYLHPGNPIDRPAMYEGRPELWGPMWSWGVETATHALRIVASGVFDRHPAASLILGHMGEALPAQLWRLDSRWDIANKGERRLSAPPSSYFKRNIAVTTSGVCANAPLLCALSALGEDRVMFSIDYPFEQSAAAGHFMDAAPVGPDIRAKIEHANAERLLAFRPKGPDRRMP